MNRISMRFAKELKGNGLFEKVSHLKAYVGDIHNHCGISYGYGTIENAVKFAINQLDFFSVTGHFAWPDMESNTEMKIPPEVICYHKEGFKKLRENWPHYMEVMQASENEGVIPFFSYEYHSFEYGDYTILCRNTNEELPPIVPEGEQDLRLKRLIEGNDSQTERFLATPHHIGYKTGYRGINWSLFSEKVSPLVEIVSMHGCAESEEARPQYLHTMGPRSLTNTYQGGLKLGHHFGVVGSTDHHNAAPGSYGFGRTVIFLENLSRDSVWNALKNRKTSAATGDPIEAMLFVNGKEAGSISDRHNGLINVDGYVAGFDKLEKVEIIQEGNVLHGCYSFPSEGDSGYISFRFGWGKKHQMATWDIKVYGENCQVFDASPRLRGIDMVDPLDTPQDAGAAIPKYVFDGSTVSLHMVTDGNPTAQTDNSNGFVLGIKPSEDAKVICEISVTWDDRTIQKRYVFPVDALTSGQLTEYVDGFVSPAIEVGKFRTVNECSCHINATLNTDSQGAIYMRAYQKNGDGVFTSPVSFR